MPKSPTTITFTYHDPSLTFDGTPYQAAGKAANQTANIARFLISALDGLDIQARNAFMQRNLDSGHDANAGAYADSPEAKVILSIRQEAEALTKRLQALDKAVSYDPSAPLPKA